jgi:hypothetical protein
MEKEDHHPLADSELDAVTGGYWSLGHWNLGDFLGLPRPSPTVTVNGGPSAFVAPLRSPS